MDEYFINIYTPNILFPWAETFLVLIKFLHIRIAVP